MSDIARLKDIVTRLIEGDDTTGAGSMAWDAAEDDLDEWLAEYRAPLVAANRQLRHRLSSLSGVALRDRNRIDRVRKLIAHRKRRAEERPGTLRVIPVRDIEEALR